MCAKYLGASIWRLWLLLSNRIFGLDYHLHSFIASPVAYYFMDEWLQDYQYRTAISWWIFAAAERRSIYRYNINSKFSNLKNGIP